MNSLTRQWPKNCGINWEVRVVVLGSSAEGKVSLVAFVAKPPLTRQGVHAGKIVSAAAQAVGGGGGGRLIWLRQEESKRINFRRP